MSTELKLSGFIKSIGEVQEFESGFKKLEFVIETKEQYPQMVKFEILKDKIDNFLQYKKVGDEVAVSFNVRGSEYKGRHYVNLQAWKVWKFQDVNDQSPTGNEGQPSLASQQEDDLPF